MPRISLFWSVAFVTAAAAQPPQWVVSQQSDALRGTSFTRYVLKGRFLTEPKRGSASAPSIVLECAPGRRMKVFGGAFIDGYVSLGVTLDSTVVERDGILTGKSFGSGILASYRLDDGRIHQEYWSPSTDISGAFFQASTLNNILYGHIVPHKEGTSAPVKKVVIAVNEYLAREVVMQFDMPDMSEVASTCGVSYRKR